MSANINVNRFTGTASFVSAIQPAWHKLGKVLPSVFTAEEAIEYANMNYDVELAPLIATTVKGNVTLPNYYATYRTDTLETFGVVGDRYEVVQNNAAFSFFDSIVGEKQAIYETAGVLGKGEIIFLTAKLPNNIVLPGEDIIDLYLLFTMGHDGTKPINALFTPTRVVCANTLAIALSKGSHKITIKHTKSAQDKIKEAAKLMGIVNKSTTATNELLQIMAKTRINDDQLANYLKLIFLTEEEIKRLAATGDHRKAEIPTRTVMVMEQIYHYSSTGVGQDKLSTKGTLFGAYSGVTSWLFNSKGYKNDEVRMKNLVLEGTDYKVNSLAYNVAAQAVKNTNILTF